MENRILDPPIPYIGPLRGKFGFTPGKLIKIQGTVPGGAYRFNINLQCGPKTSPRDDIAMQVSFRLLEGYIAFNSLKNGIWDEEQNCTLPIKRSVMFEIALICDFNQYKVTINGQLCCEFPQKIHYDRITHLAIDGDVSIIQISCETAPGGGGSGIGFISDSGTSAPVAYLPVEDDEFEIITPATTTGAHPPGIHSPSAPGYSGLPSYEAAMDGPPYPTGDASHPFPYSKGEPGVSDILLYPSPSASKIPPPLPYAPIPLNAVSSNFRPVTTSKTKSHCCCGVFIIIGIAIILTALISKSTEYKSGRPYGSF